MHCNNNIKTKSMEKNYLLLTLGHGSSAIFVDVNKGNTIGYEQERISGIKSDSQFPIDAINEIRKHITQSDLADCSIRISHWFNTVDNTGKKFQPSKYMTEHDYLYLKETISNDIQFTCIGNTHHDAHALSACGFFTHHLTEEQKSKLGNKPVYVICADGFGTNEEVLSVYKMKPEKTIFRQLIKVKGYRNSLGLMYQYATSFCGMKENQDEYKFLGYEAHIDEVLDDNQIDVLDNYVESIVHILYKGIDNSIDLDFDDEEITNKVNDAPVEWKASSKNEVINFVALRDAKKQWHKLYKEIIDCFNQRQDIHTDLAYDSFNSRCIIAYVIQQTIEIYMTRLINYLGAENVIVTGGCFYNVKLNNKILKSVKGLFCAMPLAGDQGAAIGMMIKEIGYDAFNFSTLAIGERRMYNIDSIIGHRKNVFIYDIYEQRPNVFDIVQKVARKIADGHIVNIISGNMEFGPRALCNTSTICLPTTENVAANNTMNNRNEVMPCAPICTAENAEYLFDKSELGRVVGSDKFMICTHDYKIGYSKTMGGIMHKKTREFDVYTGRPQIVEQNTFMWQVLKEVEKLTGFKCLVNTSFNAHGRPIVFETMDIIHNFNYQCEHAPEGKEPILFIIK